MNVLQWGPLFYHGSDIESRFVHHGYISKDESPETADRAWALFWADVDRLVEGCDEYGNPFAKDADGTVWKFVFLFCEQDFDMDVGHGLPNYKKPDRFCKHCRATNFAGRDAINPHPMNDLRPTASWRGQSVTDNE